MKKITLAASLCAILLGTTLVSVANANITNYIVTQTKAKQTTKPKRKQTSKKTTSKKTDQAAKDKADQKMLLEAKNYLPYIKFLTSISKEIDSEVKLPENRTSTKLLDLMPEDTVIYAAIPNLSDTLDKAGEIFRSKLSSNPELQKWYTNEQTLKPDAKSFNSVVMFIRELGLYLGDEIVISSHLNSSGLPAEPVLLAELRNNTDIKTILEANLSKIGLSPDSVKFVGDNLITSSKTKPLIYLWYDDKYVAASTNHDSLAQLTNSLKNGSSKFKQSQFYSNLASSYSKGTGFLIAGDLQKLVSDIVLTKIPENYKKVIEQLGLTDIRHLIIENKITDNESVMQLNITYKKNDHGITAWYDKPGHLKSLNFISPEATYVGAGRVSDPTLIFDDIAKSIALSSDSAEMMFKGLQTEFGFDIRKDFVEPLGKEYAIALESSSLLTPAGKLIIEVKNQTQLQASIERVIKLINSKSTDADKKGLEFSQSDIDGLKVYTLSLKSESLPIELNYTYIDGFLVGAMSKEALVTAIKAREKGETFAQSTTFKAMLGKNQQAMFTGIGYQNIYSELLSLAYPFAMTSAKDKDKTAMLIFIDIFTEFVTPLTPCFIYTNALEDRWLTGANLKDGPFGLKPSTFLLIPALGFQNHK